MFYFVSYLVTGFAFAKPYWWDHPRAVDGGWRWQDVDVASITLWMLFWPFLVLMRILMRSGD